MAQRLRGTRHTLSVTSNAGVPTVQRYRLRPDERQSAVKDICTIDAIEAVIEYSTELARSAATVAVRSD